MDPKKERLQTTEKAFIAGMNYLSYSDHTAKEVITRLRDKGFEDEVIAGAMKKLTEHRYVDDVRYAQSFIRSRLAKNKSINRIAYELKGKGLSRDDIEQAKLLLEDSEEIDLKESELERAVAAAEKAVSGRELDDKTMAKAARRLAYLGFSGSTIHSALDRIRYSEEDDY